MEQTGKNVSKFEFQAEIKQLLDLIANSLYTHREIFLRELISNSSDALDKIRFSKLAGEDMIEPEEELKIEIETDEKNSILRVSDNGIGMTKEDLINNLGTIARSGTADFLRKVKEQERSFDKNLIGQFGVGFYSVFMVAGSVTVDTRYAASDGKGWRWQNRPDYGFNIEEIDKNSKGTTVELKLKEDAKEFSKAEAVKQIINKYSNFLDFPIYLEGKRLNTVGALWHRKKENITPSQYSEFYKFITHEENEPLGFSHLAIEGTVNFKALIFIPSGGDFDLYRLQSERGLHLYSNKILIKHDHKDLLPEYLRFVRGVVDTEDLPLNVSREVTQHSPAMVRIRKFLTTEILKLLKSWADTEPSKYKEFCKDFGPLFKTGINTDFANRGKIIELLRFQTSMTEEGETISLKDYKQRMHPDQKEIYYICGENRELLESHPNLEYFKKKSLEVLLLSEPVDIFVVPSIGEYDGLSLRSIDKADIEVMPEDKIEESQDNLTKSFIAFCKDLLADKVKDVVVSRRLVDFPVTLLAPKDSLDPQLERMVRMMSKDQPVSKKVMEVNMSHPLIRNLSRIYLAD
ncbi:MAG: molecular chaperone HtpG, partial [Candidatus Omnitrophica bacterium]|nr:molecular chaperone HtpG [Candidatus Omnitrophota bacterium]MBD3269633.1 molecular chaperone HtpG [Candidatus Omnitrophota bacterium]